MKYRYVNYLWDDAFASKLDPVDRLVYRSNILGSDQAYPKDLWRELSQLDNINHRP